MFSMERCSKSKDNMLTGMCYSTTRTVIGSPFVREKLPLPLSLPLPYACSASSPAVQFADDQECFVVVSWCAGPSQDADESTSTVGELRPPIAIRLTSGVPNRFSLCREPFEKCCSSFGPVVFLRSFCEEWVKISTSSSKRSRDGLHCKDDCSCVFFFFFNFMIS